MIVEPQLPCGHWPIGTVSEIFLSPDGGVRVAEIFSKGKYLTRPVSRLIVLSELNDTDNSIELIFCKCKYVNIFGGSCRKFCCHLIG